MSGIKSTIEGRRWRRPTWRWYVLLALLGIVTVAPQAGVRADRARSNESYRPSVEMSNTVEGFTEPYLEIDVATVESGILRDIRFREGDRVAKDDVLATLNAEVLQLSLEIADHAKQTRGQLRAATAERHLRSERLKTLRELQETDHATPEEVNRAAQEKEAAEGQYLAVQETLQTRSLEYERIQAQLEQRKILAPIDGVVTRRYKEVGEYVAANDPHVMTIVQLDPLLATFSVPSPAGRKMVVGHQLRVKIGGKTVIGEVEFVAPVIHAQSGTMKVRVRLANPDGDWISGEKCYLILASGSSRQ